MNNNAMEFAPPTTPFKEQWLPLDRAIQRVVKFEHEFGKAHFLFACHAALPSILTPELLNLIRINFLEESVEWIAESDILLSALCIPINHGIFEVEPQVRQVLLIALQNDPDYGPERLDDVAYFLHAYNASPLANKLPVHIRQTYQWISDAYLSPDATIQSMFDLLNKPAKENLTPRVTDYLQVGKTLALIANPLEMTSLQVELEDLTDSTHYSALYWYGDTENLLTSLQMNASSLDDVTQTLTSSIVNWLETAEFAPTNEVVPVPTQDAAFIDVVNDIDRVVEDLRPLEAPPPRTTSLGAFPAIWNVPYQRNPFFTGQEDVLSKIHNSLHAENAIALSHPLSISGLGGIGKTQTALEYAYRYRHDYQAVLWARADSQGTLIASYVEIATLLRLPEWDEQDPNIIVEAVKHWFRDNIGWLLILDNMDDLSIAEPFLPRVGLGDLLFTTRAHTFGNIALRLDISIMEPDIGALLLLRRAGLIAIGATLNMANPDDQSIARAISQELDGLPLALDQAGAYIKEAPCPLPDYLARYQIRRSDILRRRGSFDHDYPASVATVWSLSFELVELSNPAAADLLRLCAFLAPDNIPEQIITLGTHLALLQLDMAFYALSSYSLISRNSDDYTFSIHRLVQAILQDNLSPEMIKDWSKRAVRAVNEAFPEVEFVQWAKCEQCLPHALVCASWIERERMTFSDAVHLLSKTGSYLKERAQYKQAEPLLLRTLAIQERTRRPKHLDIAITLNNLALLYENMGNYKQAEPLLQRALSIQERILGAEHLDTATSLNNLAELYRTQGKYVEAEPLLKRALTIQERQLGPKNSNTATSLNNLARLYQNQGKYVEAEPLYKQALLIYEEQLGAEHPNTATSLNNLAVLYKVQGKYAEAEPLYKRALAIQAEGLGTEHPDTATSLDNLAHLYQSLGRYVEAEPLYERALSIREEQLGAEHPDTATSLNNLAHLYQSQGQYANAEPLYERALSIREEQLGAEHPDTATSLNNLATLYVNQGRYVDAEPLLMRALAIREERLGPEHPDTAASLNNLAMLYESQGRYAEAEPLQKRALSIQEVQLGPEHPDMVASLNNLAGIYKRLGRYADAEQLFQQILQMKEKQRGTRHVETAASLNNLATIYESQERYAEAEPLFEQALAINEEQLGPEHLSTAASLNNLAHLYQSQERYGEAELLHKRALSIYEMQSGAGHPSTAGSLNNLALVYEGQGRYAEAELLFQRALAIREQRLGPDQPQTATNLNNLAHLYQLLGRYAKAEPLYERALAIREQRLGVEHPDTQIVRQNLAELRRTMEHERTQKDKQ